MNNLSSPMNSVEWRRSKVQELASQGYNQSEISKILQIIQPTINRDISYLRQQAKHDIKRYIDERLLVLNEPIILLTVGINLSK
jgi:transcriptional regulator